MGRFLDLIGWPQLPDPEPETKASAEEILADIAAAASSAMSGQSVTWRSALEVATVLAISRVLAEGVAQVPWKLFRRRDDGGRTEARDHPLFALLHRRPNEWQSSFEFRETMMFHAVLTGNAFAFINRRANGEILELLPYEPGCVTINRATDASLTYTLRLTTGTVTLTPYNMWHFRGPSWSGWRGLDLTATARNAIGLTMATEEFGSKLFKNGARPGGLLLGPDTLGPEKLNQIRDQWNAAMAGSANAMKTAVLTGGLKYEPLSYNAEEAQFNETKAQAIRDICAAFRVNPIMVQMHDKSAAYASVEQMFLSHVVHTLMPWFSRWEQSAENALLSRQDVREGIYTKLEDKALMRGTAKERAEYYQIMLQNAVFSRNEVRIAEDMDVIADPAFDKPSPAANIYGPPAGQE